MELFFMNIKHYEPFAWGYVNSKRKDIEYRIASGIKNTAEEINIDINPQYWFQSPWDTFTAFAVYYKRSDGIVLNEAVKKKNSENLEDYWNEIEELDFYYDYFKPYETQRIISKCRTPLQEKLELNKCCWAAGGGHSNPDYEMLLRLGTNGIKQKIERFEKVHTDKKDFYDSLLLAVESLEIVADKYKAKAEKMAATSDGENKILAERLAEAFSNIPRNKPRNFFEACQFFWLSFSMLDVDLSLIHI